MRHLSFRLQPDADLKREIESRTKGVAAGVLLSAVGGLSRVRLRLAGATPENQPLLEADGFERFDRPLSSLLRRNTGYQQWKFHVLGCGQDREQVVCLEDEAYLGRPVGGPRPEIGRAHV